MLFEDDFDFQNALYGNSNVFIFKKLTTIMTIFLVSLLYICIYMYVCVCVCARACVCVYYNVKHLL